MFKILFGVMYTKYSKIKGIFLIKKLSKFKYLIEFFPKTRANKFDWGI